MNENHLIRQSLIRCYFTLRSLGCPEEIEPLTGQANVATFEDERDSTLLAPTELSNEADVELCAEHLYRRILELNEHNEFIDEICGVFEELAMNEVQHSTLRTNANVAEPLEPDSKNPLAMIERRNALGRRLFSVAITDVGIGIAKAMNANLPWMYDDDRATDLALRTGRSGTGETRGIGLPHVREIACDHDGCLLIASSGDISKGALGFHGTQAILRAIDGVMPNKIQGTFVFATLFTPWG